MEFRNNQNPQGPFAHLPEQHGIVWFGRCHADALILLDLHAFLRGNAARIRQTLERLESFDIDEWEASFVSVDFLDCIISKSHDVNETRVPESCVFFKPTSLGVPLAPDGSHQWHVHLA